MNTVFGNKVVDKIINSSSSIGGDNCELIIVFEEDDRISYRDPLWVKQHENTIKSVILETSFKNADGNYEKKKELLYDKINNKIIVRNLEKMKEVLSNYYDDPNHVELTEQEYNDLLKKDLSKYDYDFEKEFIEQQQKDSHVREDLDYFFEKRDKMAKALDELKDINQKLDKEREKNYDFVEGHGLPSVLYTDSISYNNLINELPTNVDIILNQNQRMHIEKKIIETSNSIYNNQITKITLFEKENDNEQKAILFELSDTSKRDEYDNVTEIDYTWQYSNQLKKLIKDNIDILEKTINSSNSKITNANIIKAIKSGQKEEVLKAEEVSKANDEAKEKASLFISSMVFDSSLMTNANISSQRIIEKEYLKPKKTLKSLAKEKNYSTYYSISKELDTFRNECVYYSKENESITYMIALKESFGLLKEYADVLNNEETYRNLKYAEAIIFNKKQKKSSKKEPIDDNKKNIIRNEILTNRVKELFDEQQAKDFFDYIASKDKEEAIEQEKNTLLLQKKEDYQSRIKDALFTVFGYEAGKLLNEYYLAAETIEGINYLMDFEKRLIQKTDNKINVLAEMMLQKIKENYDAWQEALVLMDDYKSIMTSNNLFADKFLNIEKMKEANMNLGTYNLFPTEEANAIFRAAKYDQMLSTDMLNKIEGQFSKNYVSDFESISKNYKTEDDFLGFEVNADFLENQITTFEKYVLEKKYGTYYQTVIKFCELTNQYDPIQDTSKEEQMKSIQFALESGNTSLFQEYIVDVMSREESLEKQEILKNLLDEVNSIPSTNRAIDIPQRKEPIIQSEKRINEIYYKEMEKYNLSFPSGRQEYFGQLSNLKENNWSIYNKIFLLKQAKEKGLSTIMGSKKTLKRSIYKDVKSDEKGLFILHPLSKIVLQERTKNFDDNVPAWKNVLTFDVKEKESIIRRAQDGDENFKIHANTSGFIQRDSVFSIDQLQMSEKEKEELLVKLSSPYTEKEYEEIFETMIYISKNLNIEINLKDKSEIIHNDLEGKTTVNLESKLPVEDKIKIVTKEIGYCMLHSKIKEEVTLQKYVDIQSNLFYHSLLHQLNIDSEDTTVLQSFYPGLKESNEILNVPMKEIASHQLVIHPAVQLLYNTIENASPTNIKQLCSYEPRKIDYDAESKNYYLKSFEVKEKKKIMVKQNYKKEEKEYVAFSERGK